jgi:hypothetical protein
VRNPGVRPSPHASAAVFPHGANVIRPWLMPAVFTATKSVNRTPSKRIRPLFVPIHK